jgi:peptidoglycan/xylan/chitin deacetylase (PgdA/CDA1 family)
VAEWPGLATVTARFLLGLALATSLALLSAACSNQGATLPLASRPRSTARPAAPVPSTAHRPLPLPTSLVGTEWSRLPTTQQLVALTFDAGNNDGGVSSILATLRATGTPATFFLNGRWVQTYPADARRIAASYSIGNHSADLVQFRTLTDVQVRQQVLEGARIIKAVTGRDPRPWFRSPFGDLDARTIRVINSLGWGSIFWTVGTQGYLGTSGGQSVSSVVARVLGSLQPGEIVIMEVQANATDHSILDAAALPVIIHDVEQRGYHFVSLDQFVRSMGRR